MAASAIHPASVRALYRRILTIHKRLPLQMKAVGDEYAKSEFRRHKNAGQEEAKVFMEEWMAYADMLDTQTSTATGVVGSNLAENNIDDFRGEQLGQLYELHQETTKPSHSPREGNS